jgi:hypothetical protein
MHLPHSSHGTDFHGQLDGIISAIVGSVEAILIATGSAFLFQSVWRGPAWQQPLGALFFVWCLVTECWFLIGTWRAIVSGPEPWAVVVAVQQPRLWLPFRPLAGLWWVYHFSLALVWGILLSVAGQIPPSVKPVRDRGCRGALVSHVCLRPTCSYRLHEEHKRHRKGVELARPLGYCTRCNCHGS